MYDILHKACTKFILYRDELYAAREAEEDRLKMEIFVERIKKMWNKTKDRKRMFLQEQLKEWFEFQNLDNKPMIRELCTIKYCFGFMAKIYHNKKVIRGTENLVLYLKEVGRVKGILMCLTGYEKTSKLQFSFSFSKKYSI